MNPAETELTCIAFCWRMERRDGAGLALTSHDRPLDRSGISYEPATGITPTAIRSELGLEPRSSAVCGSLTTKAISEQDLAAGRWDSAAVRLTALNWEAPEAGELVLLSGVLGQVQNKDREFEADLLGAAEQLEGPVCPSTSPECRAELGDHCCRVDMAGRKLRARVTGANGHLVTLDHAVDDRFRFGSLRFLGGLSNGERSSILSIDGPTIALRSAPAADVEIGIAVELTEGCDKRLSTCSGRFDNAVNFRGEPHLPGNDLLTRYPGA